MLTITLPPATGLFIRTHTAAPVPLVGVAVDATITGLCARVSVAHRYVNRERTPIEAVYVFPLEEGAAVCGFEAVVDGLVVVGHVEERDAAFERYDEAMERGDGAYLLDEHRPDVFQASIGNLPPGREVLVRVTYVTELAVDEGQLRFTLPTTIAPKYAPQQDHTGIGQPDAEALNPPVAWSVPYGLDLTVRVTMPGGVSAIASPSHPVALALADGQAVVTLAAAHAALDRDFVLTVDAPALRAPQAWAERHGDACAIAVGFVPALAATPEPTEIVFVVDRSGSMEGTSIAEVRNALQLCLRSLTADCSFNIVGFGTTYQPLFPESRAYDQASLDVATDYIQRMSANLGGTELEPALTFVLAQRAQRGRPRRVVVLTDGQVTNTDAVIALATRYRETTRVFTFGIGSAASQHLVRGLARAGGGAAEFIHAGERIEAKVLRQLARVLTPAMSDVRLEWIGGDVTSAPVHLPQVFGGQRLLAYGLVTGRMPSSARLTATLQGEMRTWDVAIDGTGASGTVITTLAARARIRELEEHPDWIAQRGSRQRERKDSSIRQQIVDLAVRHGLMSRETSFVAVERRETPVISDVQLRRVPVQLAHGWGGVTESSPIMPALPVDLVDFGAPTVQWCYSPHGGELDDASALTQSRHMVVRRLGEARDRPQGSGMLRRASKALAGLARGTGRPPALDALVALQAADGSWALSAELARIIERELPALEAHLPETGDAARRAWATALAVVWLDLHAADWQDEWQLLAAKARRWLAGQRAAARADGLGEWLDRARAVLAADKD